MSSCWWLISYHVQRCRRTRDAPAAGSSLRYFMSLAASLLSIKLTVIITIRSIRLRLPNAFNLQLCRHRRTTLLISFVVLPFRDVVDVAARR